jgi:hypothetical protein
MTNNEGTLFVIDLTRSVPVPAKESNRNEGNKCPEPQCQTDTKTDHTNDRVNGCIL